MYCQERETQTYSNPKFLSTKSIGWINDIVKETCTKFHTVRLKLKLMWLRSKLLKYTPCTYVCRYICKYLISNFYLISLVCNRTEKLQNFQPEKQEKNHETKMQIYSVGISFYVTTNKQQHCKHRFPSSQGSQ